MSSASASQIGLLWIGALCASCSNQPVRKTTANVVSIAAYYQPKSGPDLVTVTARAPDGRTGYANVDVRSLRCRIGDAVDATEQGLALMIQPGRCRRMK